ncbi:MAG TPA: hypothetical protein VF741_06035, partial [Candidatus Aquilonibacter sp.]
MSTLTASDSWTGDHLVEYGLITLPQLDEATRLAEEWGESLSDVLLARSWIKPSTYYRSLAERFGTEYVSLRSDAPDPTLLDGSEVEDYIRHLTMPWRMLDGHMVVATANPGPEAILYARSHWGRRTGLVVTSKFDIQWAIQDVFSGQYSEKAVFELAERDPLMSAQTVFTPAQVLTAWALVTLTALGLAFAPIATLIAINAVMSVFYLGNFIFKGILIWAGGEQQYRRSREIKAAASMLRDEDLPIFTVLVPMFREPDVLPILANALRNLDYPTSRLDIKL